MGSEARKQGSTSSFHHLELGGSLPGSLSHGTAPGVRRLEWKWSDDCESLHPEVDATQSSHITPMLAKQCPSQGTGNLSGVFEE